MSKSIHTWCAAFIFLPLLAFTQQATPPASSAPPAPGLAQRSAPAGGADEGHIKIDVVVTDKSGKPVSGLDLKDFALLDNGQPAKILSFKAFDGTDQKAQPPAEIILLLDTVNVEFQAVSFARQQIEKFLLQNGGHLAEPVSIYLFTNEGVKLRIQPSLDGNALAGQLGQIDTGMRTIGRSAGIVGDGERFSLSVRMMSLLAKNEAQRPGRKLLIWVGPGWPMLNQPDIQTSSKDQQMYFDRIVLLSNMLREAEITVYSISSAESAVGTTAYMGYLKGVKSVGQANPPNLSLKVLATRSGGRALVGNDMTAQINNCVADAEAFYTLTFDPPRADRANEYHDLKVQIGKPGLSARTDAGYYDQP